MQELRFIKIEKILELVDQEIMELTYVQVNILLFVIVMIYGNLRN